MTVYIYDLIDNAELHEMIQEKRISKQVHPDLPISIYNYTNRAQFMGKWTKAERVCRGLIVEDGTGKVIARGPEKFFNYGQTGAPEVSLETPVTVTTKHDGSLGILWKYQGEYGVATRGSFTSEQAVHATKMLCTWTPDIDYADERGFTRIVEIVYPGNRIVLDYGIRDELIPIGTVDNFTGLIRHRPPSVQVPYSKVVSSGYRLTLEEAINRVIPADEEGYVLDLHGEGGKVIGHVKLKGEEYKILHGLLTNTNARRIWVQLAARECHQLVADLAVRNEKEVEKVWATYLGSDPEDFKRVNIEKDIVETLLTNVPDEFYDWVTKKIDSINDTVSDLLIQGIMLGGQISLTDDKRKRHELVKHHPLCKEILAYAEDRDESRLILKAWKLAQPEGDDTPFRVDED
jgi:RNA ligase